MDDVSYDIKVASDEQLVELCKGQHNDAYEELFNRYKNLCEIKSRKYFIVGGDFQDIVQEGFIGLTSAINSYNPSNEAKFETFANLCIERQIQSAIKHANTMKHSMLSNAMSLNYENDNSAYDMAMGKLVLKDKSPEEQILDDESVEEINTVINKALSAYEQKVLELYIHGDSYNEIATKLNKTDKSIDNAIQRIRKKLKNALK